MIELFWTKNEQVHKKTEILIARKLSVPFKILRTENGKPYIEGNPLFFSVSHSGSRAVIALCDKPVGVDLERCDAEKNFSHVLARFTEREKEEIGESAAAFYKNWTAKEAYIKMIGGTLAHDLTNTEYVNRRICRGASELPVAAMFHSRAGIYAVCAEGYAYEELCKTPLKLFRLRKEEKTER